jgi:hypothetical protein
VKLLTIDGKVPQALVGDEEHPPVVGPAPTNLELARAVAFILRKAMNLQEPTNAEDCRCRMGTYSPWADPLTA